MMEKRPSYKELEKRVQKLENESLVYKQIEAELLEQHKTLKAQNIALVRKSIDLSDIKREMEDKNYELEVVQSNLEESMGAVRESEERFRSLVETTSDWIWEVDADGQYIYASPKVKDLLGLEPRDIIGRTPFDLMPPEEGRHVAAEFKRIVEGEEPFFGLENQNLHKDGRVVWLETSGVPLFDPQGKLRGYRGIDRDITDRKQAEQALQQSEERFRKLFEQSNDAVLIHTLEGNILDVNSQACKMLGYERPRLLGLSVSSLHPEESLHSSRKAFQTTEKTGAVRFESKFEKSDGTIVDVDISSKVVDLEDGIVQGVVRDITDRKQAERALGESEERYRSVVDNIGIGVAVISQDMEILTLNNQMRKWFPLIDETKRPICFQAFNDPPRDKICWYCPTHKTLKDGQVHEAVTETPSGKDIRHYRIVSSPIKDHYGNTVRAIEMVEDVTDRNLAEEELRKSEERFRQLSDAAFEAIVIHEEGVILRANDQYFRMFGYEPHELLGKPGVSLTVAEESSDLVKQRITSGSTEPYEFVGIRKDGTKFSVESRIRTMEYEGRNVRVAVMRDVTVRRLFEEQLVAHREKLRSLASELSLAEERERRRIAAEVHDHISQDLAFAKIKLTELRTSTSSQDFVCAVDEVTKFVDRSIQDIRALVSEIGSPVLYELGFVPAVQWLAQRTENRHGIVITFDDDRASKPLGEDVQVLLFQSVRELLVNISKHSEARTGKVSISRNGDQIRVDVEDDGVGFDTAEIASSVDKAGGFGLFSIQERLEPFGGSIEVKSQVGEGTRITLVAPLKENPPL